MSRTEKQLKRAQRSKKSHPYLLLCKGPAEQPYPVHSSDWGMMLPVDDNYWTAFPMKEHSGCTCSVRQVSQREYERRS